MPAGATPPLPKLDQAAELISAEEPFHAPLELPLDGALATAVQNRPETGAAVERIKAAEIGKTISSNQLLPQLALVLENSPFDLRGDSCSPTGRAGRARGGPGGASPPL